MVWSMFQTVDESMPPFTLKRRQLLRNCREPAFCSQQGPSVRRLFLCVFPHSIFSSILPSTGVMLWNSEDSTLLLHQEPFLTDHSCEHTSLLNAPPQGIQIQLHPDHCLQHSLLQWNIITNHCYKICINSYLYVSFFSSFAFHDILLPADHILYSTPWLSFYLHQIYLLSMIHCLHSFDATPLLQL